MITVTQNTASADTAAHPRPVCSLQARGPGSLHTGLTCGSQDSGPSLPLTALPQALRSEATVPTPPETPAHGFPPGGHFPRYSLSVRPVNPSPHKSPGVPCPGPSWWTAQPFTAPSGLGFPRFPRALPPSGCSVSFLLVPQRNLNCKFLRGWHLCFARGELRHSQLGAGRICPSKPTQSPWCFCSLWWAGWVPPAIQEGPNAPAGNTTPLPSFPASSPGRTHSGRSLWDSL